MRFDDDDPLAPPEDDQDPPPAAGAENRPAQSEADESGEPAQEASDGGDADTAAGDDAGDEASSTGEKEHRHGSLHEGEFTAPSVGPHTTFDKRPPEERLDFDKISDIDALGKEKRRTVVGGTYGPTRARVAATFATFFAVVAALAVGFYLLAQELDQPPAENAADAPWAEPDAAQRPPRELQ